MKIKRISAQCTIVFGILMSIGGFLLRDIEMDLFVQKVMGLGMIVGAFWSFFILFLVSKKVVPDAEGEGK